MKGISQKVYAFLQKHQLTGIQKKVVTFVLGYLQIKGTAFSLDYSVENEIVFVKKTDAEQKLLVIDDEGEGMFSIASRESRDKHQRHFFDYDKTPYNVLIEIIDNFSM